MLILLTVPHATPPPRWIGKHPCDVTAETWAHILAEEFGESAMVLTATVHRDAKQGGADQNRPIGRGTIFRNTIDDLMSTTDLLLDIHSFPSRDSFGGDWDVVLLNPPEMCHARVAQRMPLRLEILQGALTRRGFHTTILRGNCENDIVVQARRTGTPAILVEMSERLDIAEAKNAVRAAFREWVFQTNSVEQEEEEDEEDNSSCTVL